MLDAVYVSETPNISNNININMRKYGVISPTEISPTETSPTEISPTETSPHTNTKY